MILNTINSTVQIANTTGRAQAQPGSTGEEITFTAEDLSFINDPEYTRAQKDLVNLKRVEKGLKDPSQMDQDIRGRVEILSRQRTDKTYYNLLGLGFLPGGASILGALFLAPTPLGVAASIGILALGLVGGNGYIMPKYVEPYLMRKNTESVIDEAKASIDSEIEKSEAKLSEIKEKAIEKAKSRRETNNVIIDEQSVIGDEDDCIVIGGIKLSKHKDAGEEQNGGLMHFLTDPFRLRRTA